MTANRKIRFFVSPLEIWGTPFFQSGARLVGGEASVFFQIIIPPRNTLLNSELLLGQFRVAWVIWMVDDPLLLNVHLISLPLTEKPIRLAVSHTFSTTGSVAVSEGVAVKVGVAEGDGGVLELVGVTDCAGVELTGCDGVADCACVELTGGDGGADCAAVELAGCVGDPDCTDAEPAGGVAVQLAVGRDTSVSVLIGRSPEGVVTLLF